MHEFKKWPEFSTAVALIGAIGIALSEAGSANRHLPEEEPRQPQQAPYGKAKDRVGPHP